MWVTLGGSQTDMAYDTPCPAKIFDAAAIAKMRIGINIDVD
jgi:hypothetical protein